MIFDHDWWFGGPFDRQLALAREACTRNHFPDESDTSPDSPACKFQTELETRTVIYLRDGFSYELRQLTRTNATNWLSFECQPSDTTFRVGAFVLSVPFEEVCRVETFAVHPTEKPDEAPTIKGFSGGRAPGGARADGGPVRSESRDSDDGEYEEDA